MAWLLTLSVTLGCISLLYLRLPCVLSGLARPRQPLARTPSSGLPPWQPAPQPMFRKLHQAPQPQKKAPQPQKRASLAPMVGQPLQHGGPRHSRLQRHLGPRRPHAQLLRVGCVLGTCQVQNLSHRLWQLVGPAGRRNSAPVDPSSPHSYG
ncbi:PREDICTED: ADM2 [Dipodomys ordii]|uniref:ADM2 n=1 Tax=Dipodomys ordii TaxID=10020 RepID=A0A1S3FXA8_DIPOR|nr:PREDICTED: ADM2 [Dipodomys ordii]